MRRQKNRCCKSLWGGSLCDWVFRKGLAKRSSVLVEDQLKDFLAMRSEMNMVPDGQRNAELLRCQWMSRVGMNFLGLKQSHGGYNTVSPGTRGVRQNEKTCRAISCRILQTVWLCLNFIHEKPSDDFETNTWLILLLCLLFGKQIGDQSWKQTILLKTLLETLPNSVFITPNFEGDH